MMFLLKQTDCWINDDGDNGATNDTDLLYPRWTQRKMNSPKKKKETFKKQTPNMPKMRKDCRRI